jgi:hypothetical protein
MMGYGYLGKDIGQQDAFYWKAKWKCRFVLSPKRCEISKKIIWLEYAYKGTAIWSGPDGNIVEYHWVTKEEFIVGRLKGQL